MWWDSAVGFIITLTLSLLAAPLTVTAQPRRTLPRVGVLDPSSPPGTSCLAGFRQGLRDLGYVDGQTIILVSRYAEDQTDRLPALATELVRLTPDVLWTHSNPAAQAAIHATTTIPIVFVGALDPVGRGLVASLARPGGNVTGVAFDRGPEIAGKQLELLKAAVPTVSRVAMLVGHERWPTDEAQEQVWERAARGLGLTLRYFYVGRSEALTAWAFPAITADAPPIDALHVGGGPPVFGNRRQIADFALQHRLPMIGAQRPFAEAGSLLSYGPTQREIQGRAVVLVDKIIKGAKPADLPVEQPTKFELVVNLKTAQALGLTMPPTFLFLADEVIR
jgi:putative ABC transport system substrate-binding protein